MRVKKLSEAEFQKQVIQMAQRLGWRVAHFRKVRVQRANGTTYYETPVAADGKGWLDLFLVHPEWHESLAIELKIHPNDPTEEQTCWQKDLILAGIPAFVYYPEDWALIEKALGVGR